METLRWWVSLNEQWKRWIAIHIRLQEKGIIYEQVLENVDSYLDDIGIIYYRICNEEFKMPSVLDFEKAMLLQYFYLRPTSSLGPEIEGFAEIIYDLISDVEPLKALKQLQIIDIAYNAIKDLSPISGCANLKILNCQRNQLESISPVSQFGNLYEMNISENQITDLTPIQNLQWLRHLDCKNNPLLTLRPIQNLIRLEYFDCSDENSNHGCQIDANDLSYLVNSRKLKYLNLRNPRLETELILLGATEQSNPFQRLKSILSDCAIIC